MREILLAELVKDVLGPRGGIRELLAESPLGEYITGVLAPASASAAPDPDSDADLMKEDTEGEGDEGDDAAPSQVSPVLSPQSRPSSLGISFIVEPGDAPPTLSVCLTWARYQRLRDAQPSGWLRAPRWALLQVPLMGQTTYLNSNGVVCPPADAEVSFHVVTRPSSQPRTLVSLYLVNRLAVVADGAVSAELHVFQPQIRVLCNDGATVVPGLEAPPHSEDEQQLQFLYRDRPVLARGQLCSAMWRAIDPEREDAELPADYAAGAAQPPFRWLDGEVLPDSERPRFTHPDVRTEYVPAVCVQSPMLALPAGYADGVELDPLVLSEYWEPARLRAALEPLSIGYRRWIDERRGRAETLTGTEKSLGDSLIAQCDAVARRLEAGVTLLGGSDEVRLAFCFAMKAIAVQSTWPISPRRASLIWHPFQLAFVLASLESIADAHSADRDVCDLLWVPTGAGKTEAYLALIAFTLALRRLRARRGHGPERTGAGVAVISRYTLRLLTIQQFRRTLKLISAAELLRVSNLGANGAVGWRPRACPIQEDFLWGTARFAAGLWVGGSVTPNRLKDSWAGQNIPGALSILRGRAGAGEPAQVLHCPACGTVLSIPTREDGGLPPGSYAIPLTVRGAVGTPGQLIGMTHDGLSVTASSVRPLAEPGYCILELTVQSRVRVTAEAVDALWRDVRAALGRVDLACARAARPGYFLRHYSGSSEPFDFDVVCPSDACPLHQSWCEGMPSGCVNGVPARAAAPPGGVGGVPGFPDGARLVHVQQPFRAGVPFLADRVPIPAWTTDDQVYHRCPSVVIATVDKFARPAFDARASALFGNVTYHHCLVGYYRGYLHNGGDGEHPSPAGGRQTANVTRVAHFAPPDLVIQDELHLIEGPLGSLVGLYETAIDFLIREAAGISAKYLASTATVRQASDQVQAVFERRVSVFPSPGLTADDSFFLRHSENHPLDDRNPGRLYVGICAPGRGPLTPVIRIWSRLLQTAQQFAAAPDIDPYWTLVGYFNAIRELAGARALYRQDIPERLDAMAGRSARRLPDDQAQELSGRMPSTELPVALDLLNRPLSQDAVFTTSMFGTGVDVPRLGLMVVHGQPKTTSSYIQATGRVGRTRGALVAVFLRATRPRDLNHYEFFCGYHRQVHRFVEPVTVMPFAPGALERACGPVGVFLLRNRRRTAADWSLEGSAPQMAALRTTSPEVQDIPVEIERRAMSQPSARRPAPLTAGARSTSCLDDWQAVASRHLQILRYVEYAEPPSSPVVLGDARHEHANLEVVYRSAPQSLREIEETCSFQT